MSQDSALIDLFNRWEQVWNESKFDLVPSCVGDSYIRHDPKGDRTVKRDAYAAEVAEIHDDRSGIRVVVYDHSFSGDRAWFRFAFKWTNAKTGEAQTQAGMQVYRIVDGKLAGTWISFLPRAQFGLMLLGRIGRVHVPSSNRCICSQILSR